MPRRTIRAWNEPHSDYALERAQDGAQARGFDLARADWREIFLAITDALTGTPSTRVAASFVGATRTGERWSINFGGRLLDVIYNPQQPVIVAVADTRMTP